MKLTMIETFIIKYDLLLYMTQWRVPVCVTMRPDLLRKIDEHCLDSDLSRSRVIERTLLAAFKRKDSE